MSDPGVRTFSRDFKLKALERIERAAEMDALRARLASLPPVDSPESAAEAVRAEREARG